MNALNTLYDTINNNHPITKNQAILLKSLGYEGFNYSGAKVSFLMKRTILADVKIAIALKKQLSGQVTSSQKLAA